MSQTLEDARRKVDEIERWDQAALRKLGIPTPSYFEHESLGGLQKRLIDKARPYVSEELQKIRTDDVFGSGLDHVARQFLESARAEATRPTKVAEGALKEVVSYEQAGRPSDSYFGSPSVWMRNFAGPMKKCVGIVDNRTWVKP